jgi:hypothetical protein
MWYKEWVQRELKEFEKRFNLNIIDLNWVEEKLISLYSFGIDCGQDKRDDKDYEEGYHSGYDNAKDIEYRKGWKDCETDHGYSE